MSYAGDIDTGDDGSFLAQQGQLTPDSINRQLALAAALQQQASRVNPGAYGGLNSAIQNIGSAILSKRASDAQAARYANALKGLFGNGQAPAPAPSQAVEVARGSLDAEGNPLSSTAPAAAAAPSASGPLASALGPSRSALYAKLLNAAGPSAGMSLLPKIVEEAANRQQANELLAQMTGQAPGGGAAGTSSLAPYQQQQLRIAAMSGDPNQVIKAAAGFSAPQKLGDALYAPNGNGGYTPIINPKQVVDLSPSQYAQFGINPKDVAPGTVLEYNPTDNTVAPKKVGDVKSDVAQQQAIQAAAARAQALMNVQLPQGAIQGAVDYFKATGQLPPNARSPAMQTQVLAALENEGQGNGQAFSQGVDTKMGLAGRHAAITNLSKQQAGTQVNEDTVNGAMNILNGLLAKGAAGPSNITGVNDLSVWARQHTNDPDAANLVNGIGAISNEYARVMTGTTSGTPSSDSARNEAATRILKGYNSGTMQAVMGQMQQEMANRSLAQRGALSQATHGAYTGVTPTIQYNAPQTAPAAGTPPLSMLQEDHNTTFKNGQVWTLQGGKAVRVH